jgi:hypothetical protein
MELGAVQLLFVVRNRSGRGSVDGRLRRPELGDPIPEERTIDEDQDDDTGGAGSGPA